MIATYIFKKIKIDNRDDKKNDYNYGTLIKTETHYISKKVRNNGFEKESLEAIYTLTFLDKKTNIIESFQYNLLPDNIGKNYFYSFSEGVIDILSENKNDYIKLLNDKKINTEGKYEQGKYHLFIFFVSTSLLTFYLNMPIADDLKYSSVLFFLFFILIKILLTSIKILLFIFSFYLIFDYIKIKIKQKKRINKIRENLNNLIKRIK